MKANMLAAIMGAISAYIQQEEAIKAFAASAPPRARISQSRLFGRRKLIEPEPTGEQEDAAGKRQLFPSRPLPNT